MSELQRLQKIRDIGLRLHELQLVSRTGQSSYAVLALNFLFSHYQLSKPVGLPLQETLQLLADAVMARHQLPYRRLSADGVLEFFSQRYQLSAPHQVHPGYRARSRFNTMSQTI